MFTCAFGVPFRMFKEMANCSCWGVGRRAYGSIWGLGWTHVGKRVKTYRSKPWPISGRCIFLPMHIAAGLPLRCRLQPPISRSLVPWNLRNILLHRHPFTIKIAGRDYPTNGMTKGHQRGQACLNLYLCIQRYLEWNVVRTHVWKQDESDGLVIYIYIYT